MKPLKIVLICLGIIWSATSAIAAVVDEAATAQGVPATQEGGRVNLGAVQKAFDDASNEAPVRRYQFSPYGMIKLQLREYMATTVILPKGEYITEYTLGDNVNFKFAALGTQTVNPHLSHVFKVYGIDPGADTNLVVHGGSGHVYSFYLRNDGTESKVIPFFVVYVDDPAFIPPVSNQVASGEDCAECQEEKQMKAQGMPLSAEYLRALKLPSDADYNTRYVFTKGDDTLAPLRVFDDGVWTYFMFADGNLDHMTELPTIYRVIDGYDTPVNTRVEGGTVIAETRSEKWTLRSGDKYLCVRGKK